MARAHLAWCLVLCLVLGQANSNNLQPNVILILADDMGYSDIGSFGGEIDTPNLDTLAGQGVRFTQFYNTARCSPTRASLLTGRYPHKVQMGHLAGTRFKQVDGYRGDLDRRINTLPEVLRRAGYKNYMVGKWHLADHSPQDLLGPNIAELSNTPLRRGFDTFYGTLLGGNNYFSPKYLYRNDAAIPAANPDYYYTDAISSEAVRVINDHHDNRNDNHKEGTAKAPFFLYVAYTAPHWPIQAPAATINKYRERYRPGWQVTRQHRYQKMIAEGVIQRQWALSQAEQASPAWADTPNQAWQVERMAVHAAMIDHLDQGIGRIISAVASAGAEANTLLIFLSDNGASAESFPASVSPELMAQLRKFIDKYAPASGEDMQVGNNPAVMPGAKTTLQSIGPHWARVSNTPFRKHKSWVHEGGVATPLLVHWPRGMSVKPGSLAHEPGHVIDILPTILEAAGVEVSTASVGSNPVDGVSLLPSLQGRKRTRGPIYFEHEGNRAVRDGEWKLVSTVGGSWELYNMARDRTETINLATAMPARVKLMSERFAAYASSSRVMPWARVVETSPRQLQ